MKLRMIWRRPDWRGSDSPQGRFSLMFHVKTKKKSFVGQEGLHARVTNRGFS